ncbi:hypothetical protein [Tritonibacter mobilis]|uniref:hypothetical protein n=1 Tax=Tritonibacter mobilis TaxID=379347 RepID=UPI0039A6355E
MNDAKTIPPHRPSSIRYPEPGTLLHKLLTELDGSNMHWAKRIKDDPEFSDVWPATAENLRQSGAPVFKISFHEYRYAVMRHELINERLEDLTCGVWHGPEYDAACGRAIEDIDHLFQDPSPKSVFLLDTLARDRMALAFERSSQDERNWESPWERTFALSVVLTAWFDATFPPIFGDQIEKKSKRQLRKEIGARLGVTEGAVRHSLIAIAEIWKPDGGTLTAHARLSKAMAQYEDKPHSGVTLNMMEQIFAGVRKVPSLSSCIAHL